LLLFNDSVIVLGRNTDIVSVVIVNVIIVDIVNGIAITIDIVIIVIVIVIIVDIVIVIDIILDIVIFVIVIDIGVGALWPVEHPHATAGLSDNNIPPTPLCTLEPTAPATVLYSVLCQSMTAKTSS
jgi:hypothetical protein